MTEGYFEGRQLSCFDLLTPTPRADALTATEVDALLGHILRACAEPEGMQHLRAIRDMVPRRGAALCGLRPTLPDLDVAYWRAPDAHPGMDSLCPDCVAELRRRLDTLGIAVDLREVATPDAR